MTSNRSEYILALDVGQRRIGLALAHQVAAVPQPLLTLDNDEQIWDALSKIIENEDIGQIVVGWPRDMRGEKTAQTISVDNFVKELRKHTDLEIVLQDEAATSIQAENELQTGGKGYNKGMVDAQAAAIILQDYLGERTPHA